MYPFRQARVGNLLLREFKESIDSADLIWHRDESDRVIKVIKGEGWQLQLEDSLPIPLSEGTVVYIPAGEYHRVIRGNSNLYILIHEAKDQNDDGENDGRDVRIARMKAGGMPDEEIKKKHPDLYEADKNKKSSCPLAAHDLELNTKNRDSAIKAEHIQYGPLNLADDDYWVRLAEHWNTTAGVAMRSTCGNCAAFDISPRMDDCMPGSLEDDAGRLGYCWMHHFKCHSARTCYTWAAGGPIETDETSYDWQGRSGIAVEVKEIDLSEAKKKKKKKKKKVNPAYLKGTRKSNKSMRREINKCAKEPRPKSCYDYWDADKKYDKAKEADVTELELVEQYITAVIKETKKKKRSSSKKLSKATKEKLNKIADKKGYTRGSVYAEYRKGLAAWLTGHRQGVTQHQWAMARVNKATPSKPWASVKKKKDK
jgi:hypothetical protein